MKKSKNFDVGDDKFSGNERNLESFVRVLNFSESRLCLKSFDRKFLTGNDFTIFG